MKRQNSISKSKFASFSTILANDYSDDSSSQHSSLEEAVDQLKSSIITTISGNTSSGLSFRLDYGYIRQIRTDMAYCPVKPLPIDRISFVAYGYENSIDDKNAIIDKNSIMMWKRIRNTRSYDFSPYFQNYYSRLIDNITKDISFMFNVSPTKDLMLKSKDFIKKSRNRVLFHYIGYCFRPIEDNRLSYSCISSIGDCSTPFSDLFMTYHPPSVFVFDCSNSALALISLDSACNGLKRGVYFDGKSSSMFDWDDWFCFCSTDINESISEIPNLPKDFLTSCIYSPIETSITCIILQSYRNTNLLHNYPDDGFFQSIIQNDGSRLKNRIEALIESIALDRFPPELFRTLIQSDPALASVVRGFLLCQYLLKPYFVHPVSKPLLPDVSSHHLWHQLRYEIDIILMRSSKDYFTLYAMAINTCKNIIEKKVCNPLKDEITYLLIRSIESEFCVESLTLLNTICLMGQEYRRFVSNHINFSFLIKGILDESFDFVTRKEICYLFVSSISNSFHSLYNLKENEDYTKFLKIIFNNDLDPYFRSLMCSVYCSLSFANIPWVIRSFSDKSFLSNLINAIDNQHPIFISWILLIIFKFIDFSNEFESFDSLILQYKSIIPLLQHRSSEVRAATILLISKLCGINSNLSVLLFFCSIFCIFDGSHLVKRAYIYFLFNFFSSIKDKDSISNESQKPINCLGSLFSTYFKINVCVDDILIHPLSFFEECDEVFSLPDKLQRCYKIGVYLLRSLLFDINLLVSQEAKVLLDQLNPDLSNVSKNSANHSMSDFSISEFLFSVFIHEVVIENKLCADTHCVKGFESQFQPAPIMNLGKTYLKTQVISDVNQKAKIMAYDSFSRDIAIGETNGIVFFNSKSIFFDNNLCSISIAQWDQYPLIFAGSKRGCVALWNPSLSAFSSTYICDLFNQDLPMIIEPLPDSRQFFTGRGSEGCVHLWDAEYMKMVGEWRIEGNSHITSSLLVPNNNESLIVGFSNGMIASIDSRSNNIISQVSHFTDEVVSICSGIGSKSSFNSATKTGSIIRWHTYDKYEVIRKGPPIKSFDTFRCIPAMVTIHDNGSLSIFDVNGNDIHNLRDHEYSFCSTHPILPIAAFSDSNGILYEGELFSL